MITIRDALLGWIIFGTLALLWITFITVAWCCDKIGKLWKAWR